VTGKGDTAVQGFTLSQHVLGGVDLQFKMLASTAGDRVVTTCGLSTCVWGLVCVTIPWPFENASSTRSRLRNSRREMPASDVSLSPAPRHTALDQQLTLSHGSLVGTTLTTPVGTLGPCSEGHLF
jgi:hypothetical protein